MFSDKLSEKGVTPLWNVLLPVLVGGAIGVLGSFVGPYFLQRLKDAADKERKRAEKCEELIGAVVEHYHWIGDLSYFTISGQGNQPSLSPMTKIQAIVRMYFPTFDALALEFDTASNDYELWILSIGRQRARNEPYDLSRQAGALSQYSAKRKEFLSALRDFARQEFSRRLAG